MQGVEISSIASRLPLPVWKTATPEGPVSQANLVNPATPWSAPSSTSSRRVGTTAGWWEPEQGDMTRGWRLESGQRQSGRPGQRQMWSRERGRNGVNVSNHRTTPDQSPANSPVLWARGVRLESPPVRRGRGRNGVNVSNHRTTQDQSPANSPVPWVRAFRRESSPVSMAIDLRKIADESSVLLELFSKTQPADNGDIKVEHRQSIDSASKISLRIQNNFQMIDAQRGEGGASLEPPISNNDDTKVDIRYIVCYSRTADVLLLPCKHLVLCMVLCSSGDFRSIYLRHANNRVSGAPARWG